MRLAPSPRSRRAKIFVWLLDATDSALVICSVALVRQFALQVHDLD